MSEELKKETCCCKKAFAVAVSALVLSLCALGLSAFNMSGGQLPAAPAKKVVISTQYDKGQTYAKAQETKKPMVVFFYTDWCGFCQRFAPTFHKIVKHKDIKKNFGVAYVNCEKPENQQLMQEYGIEGFPTVYVVKENGEKVHLDNNTFFNDNSKTVIVDNALEIIADKKDAKKDKDKEDK